MFKAYFAYICYVRLNRGLQWTVVGWGLGSTFETGSPCLTLSTLEFALQTRLFSNLEKSSCLFLVNTGIINVSHLLWLDSGITIFFLNLPYLRLYFQALRQAGT